MTSSVAKFFLLADMVSSSQTSTFERTETPRTLTPTAQSEVGADPGPYVFFVVVFGLIVWAIVSKMFRDIDFRPSPGKGYTSLSEQDHAFFEGREYRD
jgi:hypothetical protein